ncbi:MAG: HNH endonuclease [Gammaproteobacteria bacterium]|nr:HNH endonuclease [Gammaproteobacteria bacterium]
MIAWSVGEHAFTVYGGTNRHTGLRSAVTINSIIAVKGRLRLLDGENLIPPLSNRELFRRDNQICLYCGNGFAESQLTRDHVIPFALGGKDQWNNVVTACKACNHAKGARTPEQAHMPLLAVPYVPNRAEYLVLSNRRILADQMAFLAKRFRRDSRLRSALA